MYDHDEDLLVHGKHQLGQHEDDTDSDYVPDDAEPPQPGLRPRRGSNGDVSDWPSGASKRESTQYTNEEHNANHHWPSAVPYPVQGLQDRNAGLGNNRSNPILIAEDDEEYEAGGESVKEPSPSHTARSRPCLESTGDGHSKNAANPPSTMTATDVMSPERPSENPREGYEQTYGMNASKDVVVTLETIEIGCEPVELKIQLDIPQLPKLQLQSGGNEAGLARENLGLRRQLATLRVEGAESRLLTVETQSKANEAAFAMEEVELQSAMLRLQQDERVMQFERRRDNVLLAKCLQALIAKASSMKLAKTGI